MLDINGDMLEVGRERAAAGATRPHRLRRGQRRERCRSPDRTFDGYTIAFGIRNVPRIDGGARGGAPGAASPAGASCASNSRRSTCPGLDALYDAYSFHVIPRLGRAVTGDAESYRYLVESIRRFPPPAAFARMIEEAGFRRVTHRPLTAGIVAIHSGWKI